LEIDDGEEKKNCINAVKMQYHAVQKGTVEWYRHIYMNEGLNSMIEELTKQFKNSPKIKINNFIQAILYGYGPDGKANDKPPKPNPDDIVNDYDNYKFQERVYGKWINRKMKGVQ
jgi:hypothetical protein